MGGAYLGGKEDPERAEENARAIVRRALDLGCNYIDTAPLYGASEELLGKALAGERRLFYLATKVGFRPEDFDYRRDSVLQSLERSLALLGLTKLTVAQIHEVNMAGWDRDRGERRDFGGLARRTKTGVVRFYWRDGAGLFPCWRGWRRPENLIRCCATTTTIPACS